MYVAQWTSVQLKHVFLGGEQEYVIVGRPHLILLIQRKTYLVPIVRDALSLGRVGIED